MKAALTWLLCGVAATLCGPLPAAAGDPEPEPKPAFSVGGLLFGDLYHVPSHHSEAGEDATGLVVRRAYLTFDAEFSEPWFGRLRFEANQSGEFETYTFDADFKDLYIGRRLGRQKLLAGLAPTPTFDLLESIWGLRYLEKTPMDLQGVASRDTGLSLQGPLNAAGTLGYRAMYAAPVDFGNDGNDRERWMGALSWRPAGHGAGRWTVDWYADYEALDGPHDRSIRQVFVAWQSDELRWGLQYSDQDRQDDPPLELASAFLVGAVSERWSLFGRVDRLLEPSPKGDDIPYVPFDPSARATAWWVGAEFRLRPKVALTPNVIVTHYDHNEQGIRPDTDVYLRLTLFVDFE
jgi:hypothetical protein